MLRKQITFYQRDPINHLAILKEPYLTYILEGKKTIESRFTQVKCAPWKQVQSGDTIYLKKSGGLIVGKAIAKLVKHCILTAQNYDEIICKYRDQLCITDEFITQKRSTKYLTLIWLSSVEYLSKPLVFKQNGQQAWIVNYLPSIISP